MDRLERLSRRRNLKLSIKLEMRGPVHHAFIVLPTGAPIARGRGDTKEEAIDEALREAEG